MDPSNDTEEIRRRMGKIRGEVLRDVDSLVHDMRKLTDWRYHWRNHPWLYLGTVATVGFMVVPKRPRVIEPNAEALAELAEHRRLVVENTPQSSVSETLSNAIVRMAGRVVLRSAMNYLNDNGHRLFQKLWEKRKRPESNDPANSR
jgi:hypothetical protein